LTTTVEVLHVPARCWDGCRSLYGTTIATDVASASSRKSSAALAFFLAGPVEAEDGALADGLPLAPAADEGCFWDAEDDDDAVGEEPLLAAPRFDCSLSLKVWARCLAIDGSFASLAVGKCHCVCFVAEWK
jgi:hypothetical protein